MDRSREHREESAPTLRSADGFGSFLCSPLSLSLCCACLSLFSGVTCSIIFKDPSGRSVFSKEVLPTEPEGKVSHMTATAGEYKICISCVSSKWFNTQLLKWSVSIELGDTDINLEVRKGPGQNSSSEEGEPSGWPPFNSCRLCPGVYVSRSLSFLWEYACSTVWMYRASSLSVFRSPHLSLSLPRVCLLHVRAWDRDVESNSSSSLFGVETCIQVNNTYIYLERGGGFSGPCSHISCVS